MLKTFLIFFGIFLIVAVILKVVFGIVQMLWHAAVPVFVLAAMATAAFHLYRWLKNKKTGY